MQLMMQSENYSKTITLWYVT